MPCAGYSAQGRADDLGGSCGRGRARRVRAPAAAGPGTCNMGFRRLGCPSRRAALCARRSRRRPGGCPNNIRRTARDPPSGLQPRVAAGARRPSPPAERGHGLALRAVKGLPRPGADCITGNRHPGRRLAHGRHRSVRAQPAELRRHRGPVDLLLLLLCERGFGCW